MKKRSFLLVTVLMGALVLTFSLVYAQPPCLPLQDMADELGLTDEQIGSMRDVQYNFQKTQIGLKADLKTSRLELRHLMMQENPNRKEIAKLVDRVAEAHKKLLKHNVDRKLAMKGILTQEQFEKFMKVRGERGKKRMGMGQKFRQHHPPEFPPHGNGPGF